MEMIAKDVFIGSVPEQRVTGGKAIRNFPAKSADRQGNNRKMINQVRCCFLSAVSGGNVGTDGSGNVADRHGLQPYSTGAGKYSVE